MKLWDIVTREFRLRMGSATPMTRKRRLRRSERFRPALLALEDRTVPSADLFAEATVLSGQFTSSSGDNTDATVETGEPDHLQFGEVNSVWWQWTAPADGLVEVNTVGSSIDTFLAVYTGSSVDALDVVDFNDDHYDRQSRVLFTAVEGTTYRIQVDGYGHEMGPVAVNLAMSPANDNFSGALPISVGTYQGSNIAATAEVGEPAGAATSGEINSVWYVWTADTNSQVEFNTFGSNFDTLLGVYSGDSLGSLSLVAANDDAAGGLQSQVTFDPVMGTTYFIAIDGMLSETGSIVLNHPPQSGEANNPPSIQSGQSFSVNENSFGGTIVGTVLASDPDRDQQIRFDIIGGNTGDAFFIDPLSGVIVVNDGTPLDHEVNPIFELVVRVTDNGVPEQSTSAVVTITVDDREDAPVFDETGPFFVGENSPQGTVVGAVSAHDIDPGQSITYSIRSGNDNDAFVIDPITGVISVRNSDAIDYEVTAVFTLEVVATDDGTTPLSSSAFVTVFVENGNEAPVIADQTFSINENSPVGTLVGVVHASDPDAMQTLTYTIVSGNEAGAFTIDPQSGWVTVVDREPLNYEAITSFSLTVRVTDSGSPEMSCSANVTIDLVDVNETAAFTSSGPFTVEENSAFGTLVGTVSAVDEDQGQTLHYFIINGNINNAFAIDSETGAITVAGSLDFELRPSYTLTVLAIDDGTPALNVATAVVITLTDVNDAPVLDAGGAMSLNPINQGAVNNSGTLVSTILASAGSTRVTDQDAGAVQGLAIINADTTNGSWQFSIDGGSTWSALGDVSEQSARLLAADALVRFIPAFGFSGTVGVGITFRAWDQTSGMNGHLADTTLNGGRTAFSSAVESASIKVRSPIEQVVQLTVQVRSMANAGLISGNDANQLITKLNHAKKQLEFGNLIPAENQLTFFKDFVLEMVSTGRLASVYGDDLIARADDVIVSMHS